jgi:hypothetical protein
MFVSRPISQKTNPRFPRLTDQPNQTLYLCKKRSVLRLCHHLRLPQYINKDCNNNNNNNNNNNTQIMFGKKETTEVFRITEAS